MNQQRHIVTVTLLTLISLGCQMPGHNQQTRFADPALPMTLDQHELVDYLNRQNQHLDGWRCTSTRMHVRLPNGMVGKLKGAIACQAPQYFRLTASNVIANADLGSNASRCWFYAKPGPSELVTWKHEDTDLVQQVPMGVPYIDPNWLMLVLGISPLNADDYDISSGPAGTRELWLTAIERSPNGRPLRRVIKVDTVRGVIREHSIYDSEAHPLVRAILSEHMPHNSHLIPQVVQLQFPQMDSEIKLTFSEIDTNPHLPDELWQLPDRNVKVVDLGQIVRRQLPAAPRQPAARVAFEPPQPHAQAPTFDADPLRSAAISARHTTTTDGAPVFDSPAAETTTVAPAPPPKWDSPSSVTRAAAQNVSFERPAPAPRRRSFWQSFWQPLWRR